MAIAEVFLAEFVPEMANTRRLLELVPDSALEFQPHRRSMTMRALASHIAELPESSGITAELDRFDFQPPEAPPYEFFTGASRAEILDRFDRGVAAARATIGMVSDESMETDWTLLKGGAPVFTMARIAVLKQMVLNHAIHHRAQLGVYLRMNDVPIPGMYGPSADEMQARIRHRWLIPYRMGESSTA